MTDALIIEALRSPVGRGRAGGSLADLHPVSMLSQVLTALAERTGVDPMLIDDVIGGCVGQAFAQSNNIARNAVLASGWPERIPGVTIDRQCGSSQQAAHFAAQGVMAGVYDLVVACGVESMSAVPLQSRLMGHDPYGPLIRERYPGGLVGQGISAELIAARWALSREDLDGFAVRSHQRAAAAVDAGAFDDQIIPLTVPTEGNSTGTVVSRDEGIRRDTSAERLATLAPAFRTEEYSARFPEISWSVTAGNSSQISDGASAMLIASPRMAERLGLRGRARFHSFAVTGDDPMFMLTGVIPATRDVLRRSGMSLDDIGLFEVNEAFASVVLAWEQELDADPQRVNVNGGAIALGHPLGASGAKLTSTLLHAMEQRDVQFGLQTMCEGGGMANAMILERLG